MIRPRDVYKCTPEKAMAVIQEAGMRPVAFRIPKQNEYYLDIFGGLQIDRAWNPSKYMVGPNYQRLILEKI